DQDLDRAVEVLVPAHQVILVAAVGVARRVGVVLEEVDLPSDPLLFQPRLGQVDEAFEDALAGLVVGHDIGQRVALGSGVLGVAADVEVEPGAVLQEDVGGPPPGHDPAEQVPSHLVGAQAALATESAGDPVLVLQAEDPAFHVASLGERGGFGTDRSTQFSGGPSGSSPDASADASPGAERISLSSSRRNVRRPLAASRTTSSQPSDSRSSARRNASMPSSSASWSVRPGRHSSSRAETSSSAFPPMAAKCLSSERVPS